MFFRTENTEGFAAAELALLNERTAALLASWGADPASWDYEDQVKAATDAINNEFVR